MAFYAVKLAITFEVEPMIVSLVNERSWLQEIRKFGKSSSELWDFVCHQVIDTELLKCKALTWQSLRTLIKEQLLNELSIYLVKSPLPLIIISQEKLR